MFILPSLADFRGFFFIFYLIPLEIVVFSNIQTFLCYKITLLKANLCLSFFMREFEMSVIRAFCCVAKPHCSLFRDFYCFFFISEQDREFYPKNGKKIIHKFP